MIFVLLVLRRIAKGSVTPEVPNAGYQPASGASSRTVDIDGPVHYVDFAGPTGAPVIVLVHGIGGSHVTWLPLAEMLSQTYRVVIVDLPGHGMTPLGRRRASIAHTQRLLGRFIDAVTDQPVFLVGHSMGAFACLHRAVHRPGETLGIVLVDPAVRLPDAPRIPEWVHSVQFRRYAASVVRERLLAGTRTDDGHEQVIRTQLEMSCARPNALPPETIARYLDIASRRDGQPDLARAFLQATASLSGFVRDKRKLGELTAGVTMPVLVLHGAEDLLVDVAAAEHFVRRQAPGWRLEVADGAGHVPMLEVPAWTADHILAAIGTRLVAT